MNEMKVPPMIRTVFYQSNPIPFFRIVALMTYDVPVCSSYSESLTAETDVTKPLYFWQLYSVIGENPIIAIVEKFYKRV